MLLPLSEIPQRLIVGILIVSIKIDHRNDAFVLPIAILASNLMEICHCHKWQSKQDISLFKETNNYGSCATMFPNDCFVENEWVEVVAFWLKC